MEVVPSGEELVFESDGESGTETETSRSPSPLAGKSKGNKAHQYREIRQSVPDGPACLPLPSECSDDEAIDSEDDEGTEAFSQTTEGTDEDLGDEDEDEEDEWVPPIAPTPKARTSKANNSRFSSVSSIGPSSVTPTTTRTRGSKGRVSKLEKEMQGLSLGGESDSDLSAYILPSKKARRVTAVDEESASEEDELDTIKKKKRSLGKQPATTDVEQTPMRIRSSQTGKGRQARGGK